MQHFDLFVLCHIHLSKKRQAIKALALHCLQVHRATTNVSIVTVPYVLILFLFYLQTSIVSLCVHCLSDCVPLCQVLQTTGNWYKAEINGVEGFVPKNFIEIQLPR